MHSPLRRLIPLTNAYRVTMLSSAHWFFINSLTLLLSHAEAWVYNAHMHFVCNHVVYQIGLAYVDIWASVIIRSSNWFWKIFDIHSIEVDLQQRVHSMCFWKWNWKICSRMSSKLYTKLYKCVKWTCVDKRYGWIFHMKSSGSIKATLWRTLMVHLA